MSIDPGPVQQPAGAGGAPRAAAAAPGSPAAAQPGPDSQQGGGGPDSGADPGAPDSPASPPDDHRGRADGRSYTDARDQVRGRFADQYRELAKALADLAGNIDFQGNQVGGSVYNNSTFNLVFGRGSAAVRASQITAEERTEPFVPTPAAQRLADVITDCPFVLVHGPRGFGKRAALVWALRRQSADDSLMFYLDPSTDLSAFTGEGIPERAVLVIQDLPDGAVGRLSEHALKRIESELRSRDQRLAITTGQAVSGVGASVGFIVAELDARPDPRQVFSQHLHRMLLGTGLTEDEVLAWDGVQALVAGQLGASDCSLADAARLARLLFRARAEPGHAAVRVGAQMTEYADEKVAQWWRRLGTLSARCMAISLAVLNGQSREVIAHQAQLLERRIAPAPDAPNAPPFVDPLDEDAAVSPALLEARVATETRMTEHGPIVIQAMAYREPGYPGQVLRFVWRKRDRVREALVDWLRSLGRSSDLAVRTRAATAAGVLACEALDFLHDQVISRWALDKNADARDSAAIALGPPADDAILRPTVRSLVDEWAAEGQDWRLRATAARAYGRTIGLSSPSSALKALSRLAEVDDLDLMVAVGSSYSELMLHGTGPLAVRVLGDVVRLATDRVREKQVTGRLALLALSTLRGVPPAMIKHEGQLRLWPTLLLMVLANGGLAEPAARLWQLSLTDPDIGEMVRDSLDDWARTAEDMGELRDRFVAFLQWVAADGRARLVILRQARAWTRPKGEAPVTGSLVMGALQGPA